MVVGGGGRGMGMKIGYCNCLESLACTVPVCEGVNNHRTEVPSLTRLFVFFFIPKSRQISH